MKLSEAIRAGAQKRPQCVGAMFDDDEGDNPTGSCAMGAALEGVVGHPLYGEKAWPILEGLGLYEKGRAGYFTPLASRITIMNDSKLMTREEIADILESEGL